MAHQRMRGSYLAGVCLALSCLLPHQATADISLGATPEAADITIGCLFPLSGRGGRYGRDSAVGIQLAFEHLSKQAATSPEHANTYPNLRVIIEDSRSKASRSTRLVRKFVREHQARFICGVVNSAIATQVLQVAEEERVFFIGTDHASSSLTHSPVSPYYFRVNNNTRQSMAAAAHYIREHFGASSHALNHQGSLRISYIGPDYDYGYQIWQDLRIEMQRHEMPFTIVTALWPRLYEPDYTRYIQALIEQPTDLVVNALWGGDLVAFIQQARQAGLFEHTAFANFDTGGNYEVLATLASDLPNGMILSSRHHNNWPDTAYNRWFVTRFHAISGRYPSYAAEGAYAGILAIAETLKQTGVDASDDAIRSALSSLRLTLPEDPDGFTSYMDPDTHQIQQVIAIGETLPNSDYPPAERMLGNWSVYWPKDWPIDRQQTQP